MTLVSEPLYWIVVVKPPYAIRNTVFRFVSVEEALRKARRYATLYPRTTVSGHTVYHSSDDRIRCRPRLREVGLLSLPRGGIALLKKHWGATNRAEVLQLARMDPFRRAVFIAARKHTSKLKGPNASKHPR